MLSFHGAADWICRVSKLLFLSKSHFRGQMRNPLLAGDTGKIGPQGPVGKYVFVMALTPNWPVPHCPSLIFTLYRLAHHIASHTIHHIVSSATSHHTRCRLGRHTVLLTTPCSTSQPPTHPQPNFNEVIVENYVCASAAALELSA